MKGLRKPIKDTKKNISAYQNFSREFFYYVKGLSCVDCGAINLNVAKYKTKNVGSHL